MSGARTHLSLSGSARDDKIVSDTDYVTPAFIISDLKLYRTWPVETIPA